MVNCPKCNAEIKWLSVRYDTTEISDIKAVNGQVIETEESDRKLYEVWKISCPTCRKVLFNEKCDAYDFLQGKHVK